MAKIIEIHKDDRFFENPIWESILTVNMTYFEWFIILGNLQLSFKHPQNIGPSSLVAKEISRQIAERLLKDIPELDIVFLKKSGWEKAFGINGK